MYVHFKMRLKSWNFEKTVIREDNTEKERGGVGWERREMLDNRECAMDSSSG
jgi:hypothetical protein